MPQRLELTKANTNRGGNRKSAFNSPLLCCLISLGPSRLPARHLGLGLLFQAASDPLVKLRWPLRVYQAPGTSEITLKSFCLLLQSRLTSFYTRINWGSEALCPGQGLYSWYITASQGKLRCLELKFRILSCIISSCFDHPFSFSLGEGEVIYLDKVKIHFGNCSCSGRNWTSDLGWARVYDSGWKPTFCIHSPLCSRWHRHCDVWRSSRGFSTAKPTSHPFHV